MEIQYYMESEFRGALSWVSNKNFGFFKYDNVVMGYIEYYACFDARPTKESLTYLWIISDKFCLFWWEGKYY